MTLTNLKCTEILTAGVQIALTVNQIQELSSEGLNKITKLNGSWLITSKWNGKKYSLELYCSHHRSKHSQLVEAAQHVLFQVPDKHTRVGYLLDKIKHQDSDLRATITQIRTNSQGTRDDFKKSVEILLPVNPFMKAPENKTKVIFEISSSGATKYGRGSSTGVDLRWHKCDEFNKMYTKAKDELRAWQNNAEGKGVIQASIDEYFASKGKK